MAKFVVFLQSNYSSRLLAHFSIHILDFNFVLLLENIIIFVSFLQNDYLSSDIFINTKNKYFED